MLALALPVALLITLQLAGCGGGEEVVRDLGTRAVVIGTDGADWKIIDELAAEGSCRIWRDSGRRASGFGSTDQRPQRPPRPATPP